MNLTIHIPEILLSGDFWLGFLTSAIASLAAMYYALRNFNPFGR